MAANINELYTPFLIFAGIMSVLAFLAFGMDKVYAKSRKWRIRESTLLTLSVLFGAVGAFFGMQVFRHKTRKLRFRYTVPFLAAVQAGIIAWASIQYFA